MQDSIIAAGRITETVLKAARDGRPPEKIALAAVKGLTLLAIEKTANTGSEKSKK